MKKTILFSLVGLAAFLAGCTQQISTTNQNLNQPVANQGENSIYQCNTNDDCILVSIGTCCNFTSVNKEYRDEIKSVQMVCAQYCQQKAVCENNLCKVK